MQLMPQAIAITITIKTGTPVDAANFSSLGEDDEDARCIALKEKRAVHGIKTHVVAVGDSAPDDQARHIPTLRSGCVPTAPTPIASSVRINRTGVSLANNGIRQARVVSVIVARQAHSLGDPLILL